MKYRELIDLVGIVAAHKLMSFHGGEQLRIPAHSHIHRSNRDAAIYGAWQRGVAVSDIAERFSCHPATVRQAVRNMEEVRLITVTD